MRGICGEPQIDVYSSSFLMAVTVFFFFFFFSLFSLILFKKGKI